MTKIPNGSKIIYNVENDKFTLKLYEYGYSYGAELIENGIVYNREFAPNAYEDAYGKALAMFDNTLTTLENKYGIKVNLGAPNFKAAVKV